MNTVEAEVAKSNFVSLRLSSARMRHSRSYCVGRKSRRTSHSDGLTDHTELAWYMRHTGLRAHMPQNFFREFSSYYAITLGIQMNPAQ